MVYIQAVHPSALCCEDNSFPGLSQCQGIFVWVPQTGDSLDTAASTIAKLHHSHILCAGKAPSASVITWGVCFQTPPWVCINYLHPTPHNLHPLLYCTCCLHYSVYCIRRAAIRGGQPPPRRGVPRRPRSSCSTADIPWVFGKFFC